jgi:KaiC/GvpD/RAD55 family RecA-like ATPase
MTKRDDKYEKPDSLIQIPGLSQLLATETNRNNDKDNANGKGSYSSHHSGLAVTQPTLFLLVGPSSSGKTTYCREFLIESLQKDYSCIMISAAMTDQQYRGMFPPQLERRAAERVRLFNPFFGTGLANSNNNDDNNAHGADRLHLTLKEMRRVLQQPPSLSRASDMPLDGQQKSASVLGGGGGGGDVNFGGENQTSRKACVVVVDSLTEFFLLFDEVAVLRFLAELCLLLRQFEVNAIFTLASLSVSLSTTASSSISTTPAATTTTSTVSSLSSLPSLLTPFFDGILETKLEQDEKKEDSSSSIDKNVGSKSLTRSIRLLSMKGLPSYHEPRWVKFKLTQDGKLIFGDFSSASLNCTMCGKPIMGTPIMNSEFAFDSAGCVETYRRLVGIYGSSISEMGGLPSQVVNMHFFFVDIVGLSNPTLSVRRQIEKIEALNSLIQSCYAFAKTKEAKIVLPSGDGMAIGFYTSPESPLKLSMELHRKVIEYNNNNRKNDNVGIAKRDGNDADHVKNNNNKNSIGPPQPIHGSVIDDDDEDKNKGLGIRIGLSSGAVFIVNDIKGNQNVWGPGIILARRVMDIGDNMHILISENMADSLIALRDEYKAIIKAIGEYSIKHGQIIKLYSAFSDEFGNPSLPAKLLR